MTELSIDSILDVFRTCNDSWWRHMVAIVLPDTLLPSRFLSYIHESYNDFWQREEWQREEFGEAVNPSVARNDNGSYEIIFRSNCSIEIFNIGASKQYACGYFDQVIVHPEIACKGDSSEEMTYLRALERECEQEWLIFGFGDTGMQSGQSKGVEDDICSDTPELDSFLEEFKIVEYTICSV